MPISFHPKPCSLPWPPPLPLLQPSDPRSFRPRPLTDPLQHKTDEMAPPLGACPRLPSTCTLAPGSPNLISDHSLSCLICFSHADLPAVLERMLSLAPGPLHMLFWTAFTGQFSLTCSPAAHVPHSAPHPASSPPWCTGPPDLPGSPLGLLAISLLCTSLRMMSSPCCIPQVPH